MGVLAGSQLRARRSTYLPPREAVAAARDALAARLRREGVRYGDGPVPSLPAVCAITEEQWQHTTTALNRLLALIERVVSPALADPALRAMWSLDSFEEALIAAGWRGRVAQLIRFDIAFRDDTAQVLEINALFSGLAVSDAIAEAASTYIDAGGAQLRHEPLTESLATLLKGESIQRTVAVVGRRFDPIVSEYAYTAKRLARHGLNTVIAAPSEVVVRNGSVVARGREAGSVYLRGTFDDWRGNPYAIPLADAAAKGLVAMSTPFAALAVDSKRLLALLWDDRCRARLKDDDRVLIDTFVPRTLAVSAETFPQLRARRSEFVLKPADGFGGEGVLLGRECDASTWECALAHSTTRRLVAQELIPPVADPALSVLFGLPMFVNYSIVAIAGVCRGGFARASSNPVVNIARNGFLVPLAIEEGR